VRWKNGCAWQTCGMTAQKKKMSPEKMREFIHSLRGKYKFNTGSKPFTERMADLNREEKELEEAKFIRMEPAGLLQLKRKSK
jgi:hypothetical protein